MKTFAKLILGGLAAAVLFAAPAVAQDKGGAAPAAAKPTVVKVAVLNVEEILRKSAVAKNIREQIKKQRTEFQATIQKEEEQLRAADQELKRKRSLLSPEAFADESKKFQEKLGAVQRRLQDRSRDYEKADGEAMKKVQDVVNEIVVDLAKQEEITMIMRAEALIFWVKPLDMTAEVLKRLDTKLPSLVVTVPAPSSGAAKPAKEGQK
ncbi:MAG: OmpH family outer membrane protein [Magnetospirillum sp. WYHS-4]